MSAHQTSTLSLFLTFVVVMLLTSAHSLHHHACPHNPHTNYQPIGPGTLVPWPTSTHTHTHTLHTTLLPQYVRPRLPPPTQTHTHATQCDTTLDLVRFSMPQPTHSPNGHMIQYNFYANMVVCCYKQIVQSNFWHLHFFCIVTTGGAAIQLVIFYCVQPQACQGTHRVGKIWNHE